MLLPRINFQDAVIFKHHKFVRNDEKYILYLYNIDVFAMYTPGNNRYCRVPTVNAIKIIQRALLLVNRVLSESTPLIFSHAAVKFDCHKFSIVLLLDFFFFGADSGMPKS